MIISVVAAQHIFMDAVLHDVRGLLALAFLNLDRLLQNLLILWFQPGRPRAGSTSSSKPHIQYNTWICCLDRRAGWSLHNFIWSGVYTCPLTFLLARSYTRRDPQVPSRYRYSESVHGSSSKKPEPFSASPCPAFQESSAGVHACRAADLSSSPSTVGRLSIYSRVRKIAVVF